jgi:hypothetical protein
MMPARPRRSTHRSAYHGKAVGVRGFKTAEANGKFPNGKSPDGKPRRRTCRARSRQGLRRRQHANDEDTAFGADPDTLSEPGVAHDAQARVVAAPVARAAGFLQFPGHCGGAGVYCGHEHIQSDVSLRNCGRPGSGCQYRELEGKDQASSDHRVGYPPAAGWKEGPHDRRVCSSEPVDIAEDRGVGIARGHLSAPALKDDLRGCFGLSPDLRQRQKN